MRRSGRNEHLGRSAPYHHQSRAAIFFLEVSDVLPQRLGKIALRLAGFYIGAFEPFHVLLIEHRGHRRHRLEKIRDRLCVRTLQDPGNLA